MKPISLLISGLNSFRQEQFIDFTQVSDTGIFGIFGPTGSGKSTILDAITLCLYGRVERSDTNRVGIINQQENKVHVKFVFELSSSGTPKRYYVERVYHRSDEQRVKSSLARFVKFENNSEIVIADKEKEVTKEVEAVLGLTVDDFTRSVVLPQGKFAEFLTLKAQERRPMLERLFHLDQYGKKLKDRAQAKENDLKKARDEMVTKQGMLSLATKENIKESSKQLGELIVNKEGLERRYGEYLIEYKEMEKLWDTQKDLIEIKKELNQLKQNEEYISKLIKRKQNAEKAAIIEPTFDLFERSNKQIDDLNTLIEQLTISQSLINQEVNNLKQIKDDKKKFYDNLFPNLTERKYKLQEAMIFEEEIKTIELSLTSYSDQQKALLTKLDQAKVELEQVEKEKVIKNKAVIDVKKRLETLNVSTEERRKLDNALTVRQSLLLQKKDVDNKNNELKNLLIKIEEKEKYANTLKEKCDLTKANYNQLEQDITLHTEAKPVSSEELYTTEKELIEFEQVLLKLEEASRKTSQLAVESQQYDNSILDLNKNLNLNKDTVEQIQRILEQKKDELNLLKEKEKINTAINLAKELEVGKPCIVCGSTHHPAPKNHNDMDKAILEEIEALIEEIEKLDSELTNKMIVIKTSENNLEVYQEQKDKLSKELTKTKNEFEANREKLPTAYSSIETMDIKEKINEDKENVERLKEKIKEWDLHYKTLLEKINLVKERLEVENREYAIELSQIKLFTETKKELEESLITLSEKYQSAENNWLDVKYKWDIDTIVEYKKHMEELDEQRETTQKALISLEKEYQESEQKSEEAKEKNRILNSQLAEIEIELNKNREAESKIKEKFNAITGGLQAQDLIDQINNDIDKLVNDLTESEKQLEQKTKEMNQLDSKIRSEKAVLLNTLKQQDETKRQLDHLMKTYQIERTENIQEYLLSNDEIKLFGDEIKEHEDRRTFLNKKEDQFQEQLKGKELTEEKWNIEIKIKIELEKELEEIKQILSERTYQHKQLENDYKLWKQYEDRRYEIQKDLDIVSELNQVLRGNALVDFIAHEYLQNITLIASEKLMKLTRYRYSLGVDEDGGFRLIDELNGGLSRPVQTLSGGETFLTSLALALALSSQIQLKGGSLLEFFFLDEGFGSLDSDLLDTVMMSLEKLHAGHMTIGIITHIPELQSRINRKIIVTPPNTRGNGTQVKVEYN